MRREERPEPARDLLDVSRREDVLFLDRMKGFESLTYLEEYSRYHARREDDEDDE